MALPAVGQNKNTHTSNKNSEQKSVIKLNKLDVIYPDEEYSGIVIEHKAPTQEDRSSVYERPYLMSPPPVSDTTPELPNLYQATDDEGADSEEDILYASFDPNVIHYPKIDLSTLRDTVVLHLVNTQKGERFVFPTPDISRPTSHYGARRKRFHYGVDLAMPTGEPIYAAFDGTVRVSVFNKSYGNLIVLRHHNGLETYYAHMSKRVAQVGDNVKAGDIIGYCGNTGRSYGSHLHFETRYLGRAINPEHIVDCSTRSLKEETLRLTPQSFAKVGSAAGKSTASSKSSSGTSSSGATYYKVRQGDTLSKIAKKYGTSVRRLCQLNGIKETTVLSIGRRLRVR